MPIRSQKDEVIDKVTALVNRFFDGNFSAAFLAYDSNQDGRVDRYELSSLLSDAGIGSMLTRSAWASAVIAALDSSGDKCISWEEFETAVNQAEDE